MKWHFIAGEAGCRYAADHGCTAIVVDALRASATAAHMFDAGAVEILAVREVEEAIAVKHGNSDALLAGERGGLPPEGFDLGNSPRDVSRVRGRRVIFTTTTGSGRLVQAQGAPALYLGSTINASAVARAAMAHGHDIVLVPAGLMSDPAYPAQEDWIGAVAIAMAAERSGAELAFGEGGHRYTYWHDRVLCDGIPALFQSAPHAQNLRDVGLADDIAVCAQVDTVSAAPMAVSFDSVAVLLRDAARGGTLRPA